ncbi:class I SAM-dependent methyltransferase [Nocardioides pocheonensis]|uniref:Class I SAM-dependent methyltransferase n=1 Tax=Nocardioides pocheonensis TaxID=661485 RepID=A0A3N0GSK5_9ACTN|nr:class I SAM-dependent methyltransferase [Nocardioides pocheonensis]RNM15070.1 class I SAM-dependent methyltransferase [Nocardioides pocheonensis]
MSFDVAAEAYGRFMGRYSEPLADAFVEVVDLVAGQRALDVGCGPGALTARLVQRLGVDRVAAIDPSAPFVEAARTRFPGLDVRRGSAEDLPFGDGAFDAALAQLVVHFMEDPVRGLAEMARVTRPGGTVAACVWDHGGDRGPLSTFWSVVGEIDPDAVDESRLPGAREGHLVELATEAGLADVAQRDLAVSVDYAGFDAWWEPYTLGVGPAGGYLASVDDDVRDALEARCREVLPDGAFPVVAHAWCVRGTV